MRTFPNFLIIGAGRSERSRSTNSSGNMWKGFRRDIVALQDLIGRDLSGWLNLPP
jgi:hypothetical protein